jgi:AcrR family transcriptional regulator
MAQTPRLRERKKQRTRRALIEAAYQLFDKHGYEQTTVGAITAAAEVSPATFYLHFATKDDVLFADGQDLLDAAIATLAERREAESATEALLRAMRQIVTASRHSSRDPAGDLEQIRLRLITSVPAVQAKTLHHVFSAQQQLTQALEHAYSDEIDTLEAAALVGAITGAILTAGYTAASTGQSLDIAISGVLEQATKISRIMPESAPQH